MRRITLGPAATVLAASMASAQPASRAHADPTPESPLIDAMAVGVGEMMGARLARFGDVAVEDFLHERNPAAAPSDEPTTPAVDAVALSPWAGCEMDGPVRLVDLNTGAMIPLQVALASRGARAVALVTLGRPLRGRQGFSFPASRWIEWEGQEPRVSDAPGFAPDASIVLREHDAAVLSYERGERGESGPAGRPILWTRVSPRGEQFFPPRTIEGTSALDIDAAPVAWSGGTAVVFGESVATTPGLAPHRRESLWFLDGVGHPVRAPLELTRDARDDGRGQGLASVAASDDALVAAWNVSEGAAAGVWMRGGITLGTGLGAPIDMRRAPSVRVLAGSGYWGPSVSPWGVTARRAAPAVGAEGGLAELVVVPAPGTRPGLGTGALWDPLVAWTPRGALLLAGRPPAGEDTRSLVSLGAAGARAGTRWFVDLGISEVEPADVVDLAITPTDRGAVVAWLSSDVGADVARRRLALARIGCRAEPAPRASQRVGAQAP